MINLKRGSLGRNEDCRQVRRQRGDGGLQSWAEHAGEEHFLAEDAFGSWVSKQVWQTGRGGVGDEVSAVKWEITLSSPDWETTAAEITLWRLVYGESIYRWVEERQMWRLGRCQQCGGRRPRPQRQADGETWDREEGKHKRDNSREVTGATTDNGWVTALYTAYCICIIPLWVLHIEI